MNEDLRLHGLLGGGGGNVKSVQHGSATITDTATLNITINDVDVNCAVCYVTFATAYPAAPHYTYVKAKITASNNLELEVTKAVDNGPMYYVHINWTVVEFSNVKSLQKGDKILSNGEGGANSLSISTVDVTKSLLFFSYKHNNTTLSSAPLTVRGVLNASSLYFYMNIVPEVEVHWQVIEFN